MLKIRDNKVCGILVGLQWRRVLQRTSWDLCHVGWALGEGRVQPGFPAVVWTLRAITLGRPWRQTAVPLFISRGCEWWCVPGLLVTEHPAFLYFLLVLVKDLTQEDGRCCLGPGAVTHLVSQTG